MKPALFQILLAFCLVLFPTGDSKALELKTEYCQLQTGASGDSYVWGNDISGSHGGAGGAGGLLLIRETRGANTTDYYPLFDGSGHLTALAKPDGTLAAEYAYGPFGELIHAKGAAASANPWRYATKYFDEETGLYYFGHRYYDPATGQWLNREPLGEDESLNLYAYCHNDPVNKVDVLGLHEGGIAGAAGDAAGTILSFFFGTPAHAPEGNQFARELIEKGKQSEQEKRLRIMMIFGLASEGRLELGIAPHFFTEAEVLAIGPQPRGPQPRGPSMGPSTVNPQDIARHGPQMSPAARRTQAYGMNNSWNLGNSSYDVDTAIQTGNTNIGIFVSTATWEFGGAVFASLRNSSRLNSAFSTPNRLLGGANRLASNTGMEWVRLTPKLSRPHASKYLSVSERQAIEKAFDGGAVRFTSLKAINKYGTAGPADAFVLPKSYFDKVVKESAGNLRIVETKLGLEAGYLGDVDTVAVFISRGNFSGFRIATGNEGGANLLWIPGGRTSGGIPEAILDLSRTPFKIIPHK